MPRRLDATIRPAVASDAAALADLWRDVDELHARLHPGFFRAAPRARAAIDKALGSDDQAIFVAEEAGRPVGLVHAQIFDTPESPNLMPRRRMHVEELVVAPHARRRGLGRRLLDEAVTWGRSRGARETVLVVWEGNTAAARFYRALGFRVVHRVLGKEV
jgi:ribosomal protein S18 acetylase RimI-like enzyme